MLPLNRLYLSHSISEPAFGATPDEFFYAKQADGRRAIYRQSARTGLAQAVTTEPLPAGGVGYGGGLYAVQGSLLVYAGKGGRLHGVDLDSGRQWTISPPYAGVAAPAIAPCGRFVAFLAEQDERCNVLVVDAAGAHLPVKLSGDPWYSLNPAFSPDGHWLAWLEWDEWVMPWDESRVVVARLPAPAGEWSAPAQAWPVETRTLARPRVSFSSPQFSPDGQHLAFTSDEDGWRSLYVTDLAAPDLQAAAVRVDLGPGEIGSGDWVPGQIKARWSDDGQALFAARRHAHCTHLMRAAWPSRAVTEIETGLTWLEQPSVRGSNLIFLGGTPTQPDAIYTLDMDTGDVTPRATGTIGLLEAASLIEPAILRWATVGGATISGLFYRGRAPSGAEPDAPRPLLVYVHGGPTSERELKWDVEAQYWAARGWHYLLVNYRGGTGSGRAFQDLLSGQWGVVDVEDARTGAEHLVSAGLADPRRLVITGRSAGGYTTMMALTQDPDFWAAGVAVAGIGRLYDLVAGSHRYEAHYETTLIGKLPETGPLWKARSPITHAANVRAPVLIFHGREDAAVPVQQAIDYAEAVRRAGGVAELVIYEDDGHSFAREANRRDQIERTERFLDQYVLCLQ
jgi:dipeptidyl aminopeptidase/acylaminoacyl peptidase